jgi:hypothetical protein
MLALAAASGADSARALQLAPKSLHWKPWLQGTDMAVLEGDPRQAGPFTLRIKARAGTKIAPHWHVADVNITVISGTFALGLGNAFDKAALRQMPAGSFLSVPKKIPHFAFFKSDCTIQVHGEGPFEVNAVGPGDGTRDDQ